MNGSGNAMTEKSAIFKMHKEARMLLRAGHWEKAANVLTQLYDVDNPDAERVCRAIGLAHYQLSRYVQARRWFKKANRHNPTSELASLGVFRCCLKLEDFRGAFREARRYVNLVPASDYGGLKKILVEEGFV